MIPGAVQATGDVLAGTPYRALRLLGAGTMGEVFEAERVGLGRRVVVKLLHRHLFARPDLADRLRLEGEALACVDHPNVVAVLDCGVTRENRAYLVLELLTGHTLRAELDRRGKLPAHEAVDFAAQALDGLAAVHAAAMVHRDVKPENLFLCDPVPGLGRVVKLLDLGVAKLLAAGAGPAPLAVPTEEGISLGTPRFFSPEQATGAPVDARSDVYAMGVVLYAMLVGRTPFEHHTALPALLRAHAAEAPAPPSQRTREPIAAALDALILRALAKRPEHRPRSAAAFADELRAIAAATRGEHDGAEPAASELGTARLAAMVFAASTLIGAILTTAWLLVRG